MYLFIFNITIFSHYSVKISLAIGILWDGGLLQKNHHIWGPLASKRLKNSVLDRDQDPLESRGLQQTSSEASKQNKKDL